MTTQEQFLEDAEAQVPSDASLSKIQELAVRQIELEEKVDKLEDLLSETKKQLARVQTEDLPNAMFEIGVQEFKLETGFRIQIEPFISTHISKEMKNMAHAWLAENGYGDIVKDQVILTFGRQEHEKAETVLEELRKLGYAPINTQQVHPQTLKAWARAELAKGITIPTDLFGLYTGNKSKITR